MTTCCSDDTLNIVYGKWNTCTGTGDIDIDSGKTVNLVGFVFTKVVCVNLLCFNYLTRNLIYGDTQAPTHMPKHSHSDTVRLSDTYRLLDSYLSSHSIPIALRHWQRIEFLLREEAPLSVYLSLNPLT